MKYLFMLVFVSSCGPNTCKTVSEIGGCGSNGCAVRFTDGTIGTNVLQPLVGTVMCQRASGYWTNNE